MDKRAKTLIGTLIVLALLAGAYAGSGAWQKKKAADTLQAAVTPSSDVMILTGFDQSQITRIEIASAGLVLEKNGDIWELIPPPLPMSGIVIDQDEISGRLWPIANLRAERIVEESADDLSPYGLDDPTAQVIIVDSAGKRVELLFGDRNPERNAYYTMAKGDPKIYTVHSWAAANLLFTLNDIRYKNLLPDFDPYSMTRFILHNANQRIEAELTKTDDYLTNTFSRLVMTSPYRFPRGAGSEKFSNIQELFSNLTIWEFIDDAPESLVPYGLDKPGWLYVENPEQKLDLYFGFGGDGRLYAKLAERPGVFTVIDLANIVNTTAFDVYDKFVLIFNINSVKDFTVTGEGRNYRAEIRGTDDDLEFYLNGRKAAEYEFRMFYQSVIGLLAEGEYPGPQGRTAEGEELTITFNLKKAATASIDLVPYNRDFYSVRQRGVTEFLVARSQVHIIFLLADNMVYVDP
jgi:hypothetical protein